MMSERQTMQSEVETVDNPVVALYTVGLNSSGKIQVYYSICLFLLINIFDL